MTSDKLRPDLLHEFGSSFEAIAKALETASMERSLSPAIVAAELLGLEKKSDAHASTTYVWEKTECGLTLWLQWHWYDQSHPFSIQPDMNKLRLELRQGSTLLRSAESSYED